MVIYSMAFLAQKEKIPSCYNERSLPRGEREEERAPYLDDEDRGALIILGCD